MDESKAVHDLCLIGNDAIFDVLKAYLGEHPEVKVDLYRDMNFFFWTAIHETSARKSLKSTQLLLDHKADINARTTHGFTFLAIACAINLCILADPELLFWSPQHWASRWRVQ
jgi:hypothetical protein